MKQFPVDDDLVLLVWQLAKPAPFENLTFSDALRRVLAAISRNSEEVARKPSVVEELLAELAAMDESEFLTKHPNFEKPRLRVRASSPDVQQWIGKVPELARNTSLRTWQDICNHLQIEVGADSARRKLSTWVRLHKPSWPQVPSPIS